jgi:hypothetical protein
MDNTLKGLSLKGYLTGCLVAGIMAVSLMCCMTSVVFMSLLERL